MVFLVIPSTAMTLGRPVPQDVADFVTPAIWHEMCSANSCAENDGNMIACGGELCVCLFTGFFCIFCCHPVIASSISENRLQESLRGINRHYFQGNPVFNVSTGLGVQVNTDMIPSHAVQHVPVSVAVVPVVVSGNYPSTMGGIPEAKIVPVTDHVSAVTINNLHTPLTQPAEIGHVYRQPTANISNTQPLRTMAVTVPLGVYPGTVLNVAAPDGTVVQVTVPEDAYGGKQLTVQY